jgi:hypothetical protein
LMRRKFESALLGLGWLGVGGEDVFLVTVCGNRWRDRPGRMEAAFYGACASRADKYQTRQRICDAYDWRLTILQIVVMACRNLKPIKCTLISGHLRLYVFEAPSTTESVICHPSFQDCYFVRTVPESYDDMELERANIASQPETF